MREEEYVVLTRILVSQNQIADALGLSEKLIESAQASDRNAATLEVLLIQALAYQTQGDMNQALAVLGKALKLAEKGGAVRIFLDEGEPMAELLDAFSRQSSTVNGEFLDSLREGFRATQMQAEPNIIEDRIAKNGDLLDPLSDRELEVLRLLAAALSYREIAEELFVSINTVKAHTKNIYSKMGVHGRMQAAQRAKELHLI